MGAQEERIIDLAHPQEEFEWGEKDSHYNMQTLGARELRSSAITKRIEKELNLDKW